MKEKATQEQIKASIELLKGIGFDLEGTPVPRELYKLPIGKEYSVYTIADRLRQLGKFEGTDFQFMNMIKENSEFELRAGNIKRIR